MSANWDKQGNYQKYNKDGSTPVSIVGSLANNVTDALPVQLSGSNIPDGQEIPVSLNETYLTNAIPWFNTQDSVAGAAQTITKAAEEGKSHYISYFEIVIGAAATTDAVTITILDGVAARYKTIIPAAAAIGTRVAIQLPYPIAALVGSAVSINVTAPGGDTVTIINVGGYTM